VRPADCQTPVVTLFRSAGLCQTFIRTDHFRWSSPICHKIASPSAGSCPGAPTGPLVFVFRRFFSLSIFIVLLLFDITNIPMPPNTPKVPSCMNPCEVPLSAVPLGPPLQINLDLCGVGSGLFPPNTDPCPCQSRTFFWGRYPSKRVKALFFFCSLPLLQQCFLFSSLRWGVSAIGIFNAHNTSPRPRPWGGVVIPFGFCFPQAPSRCPVPPAGSVASGSPPPEAFTTS